MAFQANAFQYGAFQIGVGAGEPAFDDSFQDDAFQKDPAAVIAADTHDGGGWLEPIQPIKPRDYAQQGRDEALLRKQIRRAAGLIDEFEADDELLATLPNAAALLAQLRAALKNDPSVVLDVQRALQAIRQEHFRAQAVADARRRENDRAAYLDAVRREQAIRQALEQDEDDALVLMLAA